MGEGEGIHLHAAMDGLWVVLKGAASCVGEDGVEIAPGQFDGIMVPRGVPYAFRKLGPGSLVLLQVVALVTTARRNTFKWIDAPGAPPPDAQDVRRTGVPMELFDARVAQTAAAARSIPWPLSLIGSPK